MSDNSHSTGSSGSSTNSWTLLSPEEAAVENVGPVDDGTESLGDVPSLSEDVTGAAAEFKPSDIPLETVLSEEGHQVCQETSPESSLGPIPSSPSRLSPHVHTPLDPPDLDLESQAPVIHDIVTSSPGDNEPLGATPFVTNIDLDGSLDIPAAELQPAEPEESCSEIPVSAEQVIDAPVADVTLIHARESPVEIATETLDIPTETLTASDPLSHVEADIDVAPESTKQLSLVVESLEAEGPIDVRPTPETVGSAESVEEAEVETMTQEEIQQEEVVVEEVASSGLEWGDTSSFDDDGLRRRNVTFEGPRLRTSDEEDEEEEMEFRLAEKKEEKPFFSLNKCIVGSLILLFLGSLFLSGDFDGSDDGEQGQDWLSGDPQEMKELLDKLTQENQQIAQLEAQLQSQKEELDLALRAKAASGDENGQANLEKENTKLKEELSFLPELKKELESLRVRVTELSQLTDDQEMPPSSSGSAPQPSDKDGPRSQKAPGPEKRKDTNVKEELQRQKGLLEESRKRLQGMKKDGGDRKRGVRDSLEEIQKKLSEQVERWGKKKPQTEYKWKGNKGQKTNGRDHWKKDEKKEWRGEKDGKRGKEEKKEWKSEKPNSHKEAWRKHQDEWDRKKGERRTDREDRRKEKPWHSRPGKNSHSHHQHHQQQQQHQQQQARQQSHNDFWKDQEQKIRRNVLAQLACRSVEDCAAKEGLYPVELSEFEELLEGYLSKLEGSSAGSKDKIRKLTAEFFDDGVFIHDRVLFSDFAEDVADVLEDMVDVLQKDDDDALEEQMEEFEREALWKFAATT